MKMNTWYGQVWDSTKATPGTNGTECHHLKSRKSHMAIQASTLRRSGMAVPHT
jgi:hypothetical protein